MEYDHTQHAPIHLLLDAVGIATFVGAWAVRADPVLPYILAITAALFFLLGAMFMHLRVYDDRDALEVRFGPLRLFGTRIRYEEITSAEASRSSLIDGWGMHWVPGRGWTYNLWGFDCVVMRVGERTVRVGTDDVAGLVSFLKGRVGGEAGGDKAAADG